VSDQKPIELSPQQKQAFAAVTLFISKKEDQFFLLKGYAGTGKTTLVKILCNWLDKKSIHPVLLATTGRAAKILADKTDRAARTIHSQIYLLGDIEGDEDELTEEDVTKDTGQLLLKFDLKIKDKRVKGKEFIYVIDESSMISNLSNEADFTKFGSGQVLFDLMRYVESEQVIFVGDPCQLPPVSEDPRSIALDNVYLEEQFKTGVSQFELTKIHRTAADNEIMNFATYFRNKIVARSFTKYPKLCVPKKNQVWLANEHKALLRFYAKSIQKYGIEKSIMIAFTNRQVQSNNLEIKNILHNNTQLRVGDLLMITKNCIPLGLVNGDHVVLEAFEFQEERAGFRFMNVKVRKLESNEIKEALMIDDLLWNDNPGLNSNESQRLMIDFTKRMKKKNIKIKSDEFKDKLMSDSFVNAIQAKFGYCITCHKAQGGEWENVFLMIEKTLYGRQMKDEQKYRWLYTALTRAEKHLLFNDGWWVEGWDDRNKNI